MSEFVQATLDAITILKTARQGNGAVAQVLLANAVFYLESDLRNYLTGRS